MQRPTANLLAPESVATRCSLHHATPFRNGITNKALHAAVLHACSRSRYLRRKSATCVPARLIQKMVVVSAIVLVGSMTDGGGGIATRENRERKLRLSWHPSSRCLVMYALGLLVGITTSSGKGTGA